MYVSDQSSEADDEDIPQWLIDAERAQLEAEQAEERREQQQ